MGVVTAMGVVAVVCFSFGTFVRTIRLILYALVDLVRVWFSLGRALRALFRPPGTSPYTGPPTLWFLAWHWLTMGPVWQLFARGTFLRSYALLVVPALLVAALACAALLARSPLAAEVLHAAACVRRLQRRLWGALACALAGALASDAVRRYALQGRLFPATLRGSAALLLGFGGLVAAAGPPESGGFSFGQTIAWLRVLGLAGVTATAGVGGSTLLLLLLVTGVGGRVAPGSRAESPQVADRLAFLLYGSLLLLAAAAAGSRLTGSATLWGVVVAVVRGADAVLRVRPVVTAARRVVRRVAALAAVRLAILGLRRVDDVLTAWVIAAARRARRDACASLRPMLRVATEVFNTVGGVISPLERAGLKALKAAANGTRVAAVALLPAAQALLGLALSCYRAVLLPLAAATSTLSQRTLAPVLWPVGAATGSVCFARQAVAQRSAPLLVLLPFGAAAYVCGLITCLMAGKAMQKTSHTVLSRAGASLESLAASAYLYLDLGAGSIAGRAVAAAAEAAFVVFSFLLATGRGLLGLVAGPVLGLLAAVLTVLVRGVQVLAEVVAPLVEVMVRGVAAVVVAVWRRPEWALALSIAALAVAYAAHEAGLVGVVWRAGGALAMAAAEATVHALSACIATPARRLLVTRGSRLAALVGLSADTSAAFATRTSAALSIWGSHAATADVGQVFASRGFASAFLGLNAVHAMLLRGLAVPALRRQGSVGCAAVTPVVSFVARSSGKVTLGPVYVTAAAALLSGRVGGAVAGRLASATAPALWLVYLVCFWVEAVRRVRLSFNPTTAVTARDSSFTAALRALQAQQAATTAAARRHHAGAGRRVEAPEGPTTSSVTPSGPRAGVGYPDEAPAGPVAGSPGASTTPTAPSDSGTSLDAGARRVLAMLRAQAAPSHVFSCDACAVCLEGLGVEEHGGPRAEGLLQVLRCGHVFHTACVLLWLQRNGRCPMCRESAVGPARHANMLF